MNEITLSSRYNLKFEPWRSEVEHITFQHGGSPQYLIFASERGRIFCFFENLNARVRFEPAISAYPLQQGPHPVGHVLTL